jgi:hypothetical protein
MAPPITALADEVIRAINEARAARDDEDVVTELRTVLRDTESIRERLERLAGVLAELPVDRAALAGFADGATSQLETVQEAAEADAIGAARSEGGRTLLPELRSRVERLSEAADAAWNELRMSLRPEGGIEFLRNLADLPGFGRTLDLLRDHATVAQTAALNRLPGVTDIIAAKDARARFDEGLASIQALLPDEVREPLERCFSDELRLVDVTPEFLLWITDNELQDAFTVRAS